MLRNNQGRARTARVVFLLITLNMGCLLLLSAAGLLVPDWRMATLAVSSRLTAGIYYLYASLGVSYIALVIASYIVLIMWLRRAYYNLHQLPGIHPEYSDGWAAGAWFVPFLNFVRPFTIMREVWQDTQRAALGRVVEPATILGWWWATHLLQLVVARISRYVGDGGSHGLSQSHLLGVVLDSASQLLAAGFTWYIIGRYMRFEEELALRQQVEQLGQPAPEVPAYLAVEQANYGQPEGY